MHKERIRDLVASDQISVACLVQVPLSDVVFPLVEGSEAFHNKLRLLDQYNDDNI